MHVDGLARDQRDREATVNIIDPKAMFRMDILHRDWIMAPAKVLVLWIHVLWAYQKYWPELRLLEVRDAEAMPGLSSLDPNGGFHK